MINFTYNRWLVCLIIIGFLASLAISWQRHKVEEANSTTEIIMAYDAINDLALLEGIQPESLFLQLKEAGLTSVSVSETTLEKLQKKGKLNVVPGTFILEQSYPGNQAGSFRQKIANTPLIEEIQPQDVYVMTTDRELFIEIKEDLERRLAKDRVKVLVEDTDFVLAIKADYEKIMEWNLGLSTRELKEAAGYGFYVVPRPSNYTKVTSDDIEAVFKRISVIDKKQISAVVFTASEVLGYPDLIPETAEHFKSNGLALGLIEHVVQLQFFKQEGLIQLATLIDYNAIRLYSIFKGEQLKLDVQEAVRRHGNTDRERNIRLNLLHPFETPEPGKTILETNIEYVALVKDALLKKGFTLGRAEVYQPYFASGWLLVLVTLGISAASILLLANIISLKNSWQYLLVIVMAGILIFPILKGAGTLSRQIVALAAVCTLPVLAVAWQVTIWQKILEKLTSSSQIEKQTFVKVAAFGVISLTLATLISLVGGIYTGAILSDIRFFLEIEIFRGVKLSLIAPLILITLVYLSGLNQQKNTPNTFADLWAKIEKVLNYPVLLKTLLLFGVAALVVWIFLGRSGHTAGIPVPGIELKLRLFLEETLYARPRAKEFLFGHPAFFLLLGTMLFKWPPIPRYILLAAATIGQSSVAQTFAHMRTPVYMSTIRGIDGLALGIIIGLAALGIFYLLMRFNPFKQKESGNT